MTDTHPIYVVELANVIIFAIGCIALVLAFMSMIRAKRYRDSAKDWAAAARLLKENAEEMEQNASELLAKCRERYGVKVVATKKDEKRD